MPKKNEPRKEPQLLKGFKDILPDEQRFWRYIYETVKKHADA